MSVCLRRFATLVLVTLASVCAPVRAWDVETAHRGFAAAVEAASSSIAAVTLDRIKEKFAPEPEASNGRAYYLRARYMNPSGGRFTQQDTFAGIDMRPVSLHKYLYANADPANGRDPSGHMTLGEVNAVMGQMISRSIAITNFVGRVQTAVGTVQSLIEALKIMNDPSAIAALTGYFDPSNPDYQGVLSAEAFELASQALRRNAPRIARSVGLHRIKTFLRYVPDKKSTVIFYMPTPILTPGSPRLIPTGVPIPLANFGTRKAVLAVGGKTTRFFGMGFALGTDLKTQRQLFRMDWAKMPGSAHFPGDGANADYWVDPGFEFHVPREPQ